MHTQGVESRQKTSRIRKDKKKNLDILDVTIKVMLYKENQNWYGFEKEKKKDDM